MELLGFEGNIEALEDATVYGYWGGIKVLRKC